MSQEGICNWMEEQMKREKRSGCVSPATPSQGPGEGAFHPALGPEKQEGGLRVEGRGQQGPTQKMKRVSLSTLSVLSCGLP